MTQEQSQRHPMADTRAPIEPALLEPSFADAIRAIEAAATLPRVQQQHWCCSLRQIGKALERPLETIPARWTSVRFPIAALHHAMAGNREKTLQNHKANVRRALLWFRGEHDVAPRGVPLKSEWVRLRDQVEDRGTKARLSGLMRYCSGREVKPADVTEVIVDGYMAYRAATTRLATNDAARRELVRSWNRCAGTLKGWPRQTLAEPPTKKPDGPTWPEFPLGLRNDIEAYLASLSRLRRGANGKRRRPCRPSKIHTRRAELVAAIKTAARIVPLAELVDLKTLLRADLVERILDAYWQKDGKRPGRFTIDLAWKLHSIARQVGAEAGGLERLGELQAELETYRQAGLTTKNQ